MCEECNKNIEYIRAVGPVRMGRTMAAVIDSIRPDNTHANPNTQPQNNIPTVQPNQGLKKSEKQIKEEYEHAYSEEIYRRLKIIQEEENWDVIQDVEQLYKDKVIAEIEAEMKQGTLVYIEVAGELRKQTPRTRFTEDDNALMLKAFQITKD